MESFLSSVDIRYDLVQISSRKYRTLNLRRLHAAKAIVVRVTSIIRFTKHSAVIARFTHVLIDHFVVFRMPYSREKIQFPCCLVLGLVGTGERLERVLWRLVPMEVNVFEGQHAEVEPVDLADFGPNTSTGK